MMKNDYKNKKYCIKSFYPNYFEDKKISYIGLRFTYYFNQNKDACSIIYGISSGRSVRLFLDKNNCECIYKDLMCHRLIWPILRRLISNDRIVNKCERRFYNLLEPDDIVYLWPNSSLELYKRVKSKGCIIVSERINTLRGTSKRILDKEFSRINIEPNHGITEDSILDEKKKMMLSNYIFSASDAITKSLVEAGIPYNKIIKTSYGLKKKEILPFAIKNKCESIKVIFVGKICVRKGIHLLLDIWEKAQINGELLIIGKISDEIEAIMKLYLSRNHNIRHVSYQSNLIPIYRDADIFILPSIEEGSPLVTYLALGAGIPILASPMGCGSLVEDGVEGFIIDPHDEALFIDKLKELSMNKKLREVFAKNSYEKAFNYTWDKVADQRIHDLLSRLKK